MNKIVYAKDRIDDKFKQGEVVKTDTNYSGAQTKIIYWVRFDYIKDIEKTKIENKNGNYLNIALPKYISNDNCTHKLNKELLKIIKTVQRYKKYIIAEDQLIGTFICWHEKTKEYFYNLPKKIFEDARIKQNDINYEKILNFEITPEIKNTQSEHLDMYEF